MAISYFLFTCPMHEMRISVIISSFLMSTVIIHFFSSRALWMLIISRNVHSIHTWDCSFRRNFNNFITHVYRFCVEHQNRNRLLLYSAICWPNDSRNCKNLKSIDKLLIQPSFQHYVIKCFFPFRRIVNPLQ